MSTDRVIGILGSLATAAGIALSQPDEIKQVSDRLPKGPGVITIVLQVEHSLRDVEQPQEGPVHPGAVRLPAEPRRPHLGCHINQAR